MRLSGWRESAPNREAMAAKVLAVYEPVLAALGAEPDPQCWIVWGDDPRIRYMVLVPIATGLISCHVRVNIPGEGPRASAKLVRWSRVQLGELGMETQGGHRLLTFQVEQQILRGADADADRIGAFANALFAAIDGRPLPDLDGSARRSPARGSARSTPKRPAGAKSPRTPARAASAATRALMSPTTRHGSKAG